LQRQQRRNHQGAGGLSCRRFAKATSSEAFRPLLDRRRQALVTSGYDSGSEHRKAVAGTPIVIFKLKMGQRSERAPKRQINARTSENWVMPVLEL
jgi:hypothetical protein